MKTRRIVQAALMTTLAASFLSSCAYLDPRGSLDPKDGFADSVYLLEKGEKPADVTKHVCSRIDGCEKAAESARVRIVRFNTSESAAAEARSLGADGHQSDRFVVEYLDSSITDAARRVIETMVDNTAADSPD